MSDLQAVTLCDGVFDPLHAGHAAYFDAAKAYGYPIVVQVSRQTKRPELLPLHDRAAVIEWAGYDAVTFPTTLDALKDVRPMHYVKGPDWAEHGVPADERAFCAARGIVVAYVQPTVRDSSTRRLEAWAARMAEVGQDELAVRAEAQRAVAFDVDAQGYGTLEAREAIEGQHPDLLASLCHGLSVLDVGCGPGHFVTMLRARGVDARGIDPYMVPTAEGCSRASVAQVTGERVDVVVCREVLEHIPVREWGGVLRHLFRVARMRVYLTTRFTPAPRHPFDLTDEPEVDPSHITRMPLPFLRALCVAFGGVRDRAWEQVLDWQHKGRVLVYQVPA